MNKADRTTYVQRYLDDVKEQFDSGQAIEHAYRPALKQLMSCFDDTIAVNDPKHSEHGAPDFVFLKKTNNKIVRGHAEAKDVTVNLDKTEKSEQMQRYHGYANLFLTDYLEFRFFRNGEKYETISLGDIKRGQLHLMPENGERLMRELEAFLDQAPEKIRSGKRLAQIMGGKARRIRDNVVAYLEQSGERDQELIRIFELMKQMLVHDLDSKKFADMYAQTLVYGLFVARYGDETPFDFTRSEARDLVPKSNPFLRHFFDHIVGPNFDVRLAYIVDELCEIFSVSDVAGIVHKHLRIQDATSDVKDPIIHFYEDFLQEYDSAERKKMGAYYTPIPVVKYIVRQVDRILKEEFGITNGLASNETTDYWVETGQDHRKDKRSKAQTGYIAKLPRVQVLDPAVGTATFLNETIKYIHQSFEGQEGRWESYVNDNLLKRLYGFELMMAPYTIAHLKLSMTLKETGVKNLTDRLGVYLTNTLEQGVPNQQDLFSFGLAEIVSQESKLAAQVKSERPVMVVMGNPPYSVSSNNKSEWILGLTKVYKRDLNERKINLDDDYIKFIRFAEEMITKNGSGVVAMITNNSYIDGITHRQMRKHLLTSFNKIYVLDLHGNVKKKETPPDGSEDQNIFDIMQGVSIVLMVKTSEDRKLADVYHADVWGTRAHKFNELNSGHTGFTKVDYMEPNYFFVPKDDSLLSEYGEGVSINELFLNKASGFRSGQDKVQVVWNRAQITEVVADLISLAEPEYRDKYGLKDGRNHNYAGMKADVGDHLDEGRVIETLYRPFDVRWTYYSHKSSGFAAWPRSHTMKNFVNHENVGLIYKRGYIEEQASPVSITNLVSHERTWSRAGMQGADTVAPLYVYHESGEREANFDAGKLKRLTAHIVDSYSPEEILDYIYAILHSPSYISKYMEFLKTDFPRIPIPTQPEFNRLVPLGHKLRELHLMHSRDLDKLITGYPEPGSDVVETVSAEFPITVGGVGNNESKRQLGRVYINDKQYFRNVPKIAWEFYIGGYQPAQKWLKDRKGRKLSDEDIEHYQKIIKVLLETDRVMKEVDKVRQA